MQRLTRFDAEALDDSDPLTRWRSEFDLDGPGPIYLDGNSLGRPPAAVRRALSEGAEAWASELVGGWSHWIDLPLTVGDRLGRLLGAGPGQVAVCDSTTVNLYKLAYAAVASLPGRTSIVGDAADFPTDRYVLEGIASTFGRELRLVEGDLAEGLDARVLAKAVDASTALVCLSHVNYRSAARLDLPAVTEIAHRHGALTLWDLCHSGGALPIGLDEAGADLAVGCTYKYLNSGPGAPGYLYVNRALQGKLLQPVWGWFGQRDQFAMAPGYDPADGIRAYLAGSPPILGLMAVDAAVGVTEAAGVDKLWTKSQALTALLVRLVEERLRPLGARLASPASPDRRGAHVSVAHADAWRWCRALIDRRLVIPDFRVPDVIRLGPAPLYTTFAECFDAIERMEAVLTGGLSDDPPGAMPRVP
jgi:kynureninase